MIRTIHRSYMASLVYPPVVILLFWAGAVARQVVVQW